MSRRRSSMPIWIRGLLLTGWVAAGLGAIGSVGCSEPEIDFVEIVRIDEPLSEADLEQFLRITRQLPGGKLPDLPALFAPPPEWDGSRTLAIGEIVKEEQQRVAARWDVQAVADRWERNGPLRTLLRRERMTVAQYAGLSMAIAAAVGRSRTQAAERLEELVHRGSAEIRTLRDDQRAFSELSDEQQFDVTRRAVWITRHMRAEKLRMVPSENVELIQRYEKELMEVLPSHMLVDPIAQVADYLEEQGLPFVETEGVTDAHINWNPDTALIGTDTPDPLPPSLAAQSPLP